jgi:hypothetical protein
MPYYLGFTCHLTFIQRCKHSRGSLPPCRLQGIDPCSAEKIGACVPLTTNIGVLLNSLRWDSEWRDRTGFNGPDLIPAVNLLMQMRIQRAKLPQD